MDLREIQEMTPEEFMECFTRCEAVVNEINDCKTMHEDRKSTRLNSSHAR